MASPYHGREGLLAHLGVEWRYGKGTNALAPREAKRGICRSFCGEFSSRSSVFLADPCHKERLSNPALPVATRRQRAGLGDRKGLIVHIAQINDPPSDRLDVRFAVPFPAPLTQLAPQVG